MHTNYPQHVKNDTNFTIFLPIILPLFKFDPMNYSEISIKHLEFFRLILSTDQIIAEISALEKQVKFP